MKRKSLIIGILIAVFSACFLQDASAQRRHYRPGYGHYHGRGYYAPRPRVYVAPRPVVIVPQYGYRRGYYRPHGYYRRPYYAHPPRYYHGHRGYGHYRGHGGYGRGHGRLR